MTETISEYWFAFVLRILEPKRAGALARCLNS
jgi:hypothetical protein